MKSLFLLIIYCSVFSLSVAQIDRSKNCPNSDFKHGANYWVRRLNITTGIRKITKFFVTVTYRSPIVYSNEESGEIEKMFWSPQVHPFLHIYVLYKAKQQQPFRSSNYAMYFNFVHGKETTIHTLDPKTGLHLATRLGGSAKKFFHVVPPGVYFAVFVPDQDNDLYALLTVVVLRGGSKISTYDFADKDHLLANFSQHSDVIVALYKNWEDN